MVDHVLAKIQRLQTGQPVHVAEYVQLVHAQIEVFEPRKL